MSGGDLELCACSRACVVCSGVPGVREFTAQFYMVDTVAGVECRCFRCGAARRVDDSCPPVARERARRRATRG